MPALPFPENWPMLADRALALAIEAPSGRVKTELAMAAVHLSGLAEPAGAAGDLPEKLQALIDALQSAWAELLGNKHGTATDRKSIAMAMDHAMSALERFTPPGAPLPASAVHPLSPAAQAASASGE